MRGLPRRGDDAKKCKLKKELLATDEDKMDTDNTNQIEFCLVLSVSILSSSVAIIFCFSPRLSLIVLAGFREAL